MESVALFKIIRPLNACMAGLAGVLAYVIASGTIIPAVLIIFVVIVLITAAGNVINDYHDAAIDAINRPDRPIPSGTISKREALIYALLLFLVSNGIAIVYAPVPLIIIAMVNTILLWSYASYLKVMPLVGNLTVAYLSASIFLFGGALEGLPGVIENLPVAGATFFVMLARELIKDAEDMPGDTAAGARTLPILYGIRPTILIAVISAWVGVGITLLLYVKWGWYYLAGIIPVNLVILIGAALTLKCTTSEEIRKTRSSIFIKAGMFASLLIFLLSAIFL
ncbi:MAG TPA: geranylgeranylglycerol-phosphate geranylgeranyltransferase [Methanospirillum sp.]|nr:geranylgeranylglycerol-phosphate geranylgeranyltransferase [Methanospirillum sp.]